MLLASYFSGRHALPAYATDLLATLSDDQRLQTEDRLKSLLELLTRVPGACTALAHAVVKGRTVTGPECSPGLQLQIEDFLVSQRPSGWRQDRDVRRCSCSRTPMGVERSAVR